MERFEVDDLLHAATVRYRSETEFHDKVVAVWDSLRLLDGLPIAVGRVAFIIHAAEQVTGNKQSDRTAVAQEAGDPCTAPVTIERR